MQSRLALNPRPTPPGLLSPRIRGVHQYTQLEKCFLWWQDKNTVMDYFQHEEKHENLSAVLHITAVCLAARTPTPFVRFMLV